MTAGRVSILILAVAALSAPDGRDMLRRAQLISIERTVDTAAAMFEPHGEAQRPLSERSRLWRIAVQMWLAAPAFGVGEGSFAWRFHDFAPVGSRLDTASYGDAHNQFLQVLATRGTRGASRGAATSTPRTFPTSPRRGASGRTSQADAARTGG